jgi:hypothetical protein
MCNAGSCSPGCGRIGQACCAGDVECPAAWSECDGDVCTACGGLGQSCCNASSCGAPYVCRDGSCAMP